MGRTLTVVGSVFEGVTSRPLLVVLAAVFAGLSMVMVIASAVAGQPLVLMAAVPLALTAGLMWYQGTGKMASSLFGGGGTRRRSYRRQRRRERRSTDGGGGRTGGRNGDERWEVPFEEEVRQESYHRARRQARRRERRQADAGSGTSGQWQREFGERADRLGGLTQAEAYDVLGLDPTASDDEVREAYRQQAKTLHPDTEGGSAEEFQELNDAYERIVDE
jgi:hypothetical protein